MEDDIPLGLSLLIAKNITFEAVYVAAIISGPHVKDSLLTTLFMANLM